MVYLDRACRHAVTGRVAGADRFSSKRRQNKNHPNPKKSPAIAPGSKLAKVLFFIAPGCSACPDEAARLEMELSRLGLKYQIEGVFVGDPPQVGMYLAAMRKYPFKFDLALDLDGKIDKAAWGEIDPTLQSSTWMAENSLLRRHRNSRRNSDEIAGLSSHLGVGCIRVGALVCTRYEFLGRRV